MEALYSPPWLHRNGHLSTILANRIRKVDLPAPFPETMELSDGDFIDLDHYANHSQSAALLLHGLEGSSTSTYMLGMARSLIEAGFDVFAMNHSGCSGRPNRLSKAYHSGATTEVREVLANLGHRFEHTVLIGFSLGGNMALKLAGEALAPRQLRAVAAISVPMDLKSSATQLAKLENRIYLLRFLKQLKRKALDKANAFPALGLNKTAIKSASNFEAFDDAFTAPLHGFLNANHYYAQSSSKQYLSTIALPTLIINALNDPFLTKACFPGPESCQNPHLIVLTPKHGGHVGFASDTMMKKTCWHEEQVSKFMLTFAP